MIPVRPRRWLARLFSTKAEEPRASTYHAVAIRCGKNPCQAARDDQGGRYLSAEAPLLPLEQCDRPDQCECRYQHYDDRRDGPRRRTEQGLPGQMDADHIERRYKKDRRADATVEEDEPFSVHEDSYYEHVGDTTRARLLELNESNGVDPYNSGSFDKSKSWKPNTRE